MRAGVRIGIVALVLTVASAPLVRAQEASSPVWDVFKQTAADPTTWVPAGVSYTAERLDWGSSQVFFQHGYLEANAQFTISGRPNDTPIGYAAGKRVILGNALTDVATSAINNVVERLVEDALLARYPHRRKLIRTLGWAQRISFAAGLATIQSANHFRQWRENERVARELGYR